MTLAVKWVGSPNYSPGRDGHNPNWTTADPATWIVDHTSVSTLESLMQRFTSSAGQASSTYAVDTDGTIYQFVREEDAPWTNGTYADNPGSNLDSITIEHVDNKNYNGPYDPRQIEASAQLHADIFRRRGIPLVHRKTSGGVIGHKECGPNGIQTGCPDGLPMDQIIARANEILNPPKPPPDTRPEWEKNYKDDPQTFTIFKPVPIISLVDGVGLVGTVPASVEVPTVLVVAGETRAFGQDWWVTTYGRQHGNGLSKAIVAIAIKPEPHPIPLEYEISASDGFHVAHLSNLADAERVAVAYHNMHLVQVGITDQNGNHVFDTTGGNG